MSWYYVQDQQRKGPIEQAEFENLVARGTISPTTMVWKEGMANWQPCREVFSPGQPAGATPAAAPIGRTGVPCSRCGRPFPADQLIHIGGAAVCPGCKPMVLQSLQEGVPLSSAAEQLRRAHINHEASIKSVGFLYLLGAAFLFFVGVSTCFVSYNQSRNVGVFVLGVVLFALAVLQIWTGLAIRRLQPWSRIAAGILSGIGLLGFPLGTLINGYILYLLFSRKGSMVFSEPYKQAIAATPHIKYKTSLLIWVLLGILVLFFVFLSAAVFFAPHR